MTEAAVYLAALVLFSFVVTGTGFMRHEMLLLVCIPPVFVALVMGFVMTVYAGTAFGAGPTIVAIVTGIPPAWWLSRRFRSRDLLIAIYLAWAAALVLALVGFGFPDRV